MTSLPFGLASISARLDDAPQVRGAVDMAKRLGRVEPVARPIVEQAAIDRHAWLVIREPYRSRDTRYGAR